MKNSTAFILGILAVLVGIYLYKRFTKKGKSVNRDWRVVADRIRL